MTLTSKMPSTQMGTRKSMRTIVIIKDVGTPPNIVVFICDVLD